jgi:hypothetical protein
MSERTIFQGETVRVAWVMPAGGWRADMQSHGMPFTSDLMIADDVVEAFWSMLQNVSVLRGHGVTDDAIHELATWIENVEDEWEAVERHDAETGTPPETCDNGETACGGRKCCGGWVPNYEVDA